jgi:hypothetical protein
MKIAVITNNASKRMASNEAIGLLRVGFESLLWKHCQAMKVESQLLQSMRMQLGFGCNRDWERHIHLCESLTPHNHRRNQSTNALGNPLNALVERRPRGKFWKT